MLAPRLPLPVLVDGRKPVVVQNYNVLPLVLPLLLFLLKRVTGKTRRQLVRARLLRLGVFPLVLLVRVMRTSLSVYALRLLFQPLRGMTRLLPFDVPADFFRPLP